MCHNPATMALPVVSFFVLGFVLAQAAWWILARTAGGAGDEAFAGAPAFRFMMLAAVELVVAAVAFGGTLLAASGSRLAGSTAKAGFVACAGGATTSTIAAGPFALIPRVLPGEAQLLVYIVVAAIVSAAIGALLGLAFRSRS